MKSPVWVFVAMFAALACGMPSKGILQRESARSIGDVLPDSVAITDVRRSETFIRWTATSAKGRYICTSDHSVGRVRCVRRDSTAAGVARS